MASSIEQSSIVTVLRSHALQSSLFTCNRQQRKKMKTMQKKKPTAPATNMTLRLCKFFVSGCTHLYQAKNFLESAFLKVPSSYFIRFLKQFSGTPGRSSRRNLQKDLIWHSLTFVSGLHSLLYKLISISVYITPGHGSMSKFPQTSAFLLYSSGLTTYSIWSR